MSVAVTMVAAAMNVLMALVLTPVAVQVVTI